MPTKLDGHHLTCLLGAGVFLGHASHACGQSMDQVLSRAALNPSGTGDGAPAPLQWQVLQHLHMQYTLFFGCTLYLFCQHFLNKQKWFHCGFCFS